MATQEGKRELEGVVEMKETEIRSERRGEKKGLLATGGSSFLGVHLKEGISRFNFISYLFCNFALVSNLSLLATAGTSILTSEKYYNIES